MRFNMRSILLIAPIIIGLIGGAVEELGLYFSNVPPATRSPATGPILANETSSHALLKLNLQGVKLTLNESVFNNTSDLDAILSLIPPRPGAPISEWVAFGLKLNGIDTGGRHTNNGTTSPLLSWYAYIAKNNPNAIYQLHNNGDIDDRKLAHLIQFGFLPDWHEHINKSEKIILNSEEALADLSFKQGATSARRTFLNIFFHSNQQNTRLQMENLRFSLPEMQPNEITETISRLQNGAFKVDPRTLNRLMLGFEFQDRKEAMLSIMAANEYGSRSMSSYFTTGAKWGNRIYLENMIHDVTTNADQPTNFYCAACGLALVSDGLLGSSLLNAVREGNPINITWEGNQFILSTSP